MIRKLRTLPLVLLVVSLTAATAGVGGTRATSATSASRPAARGFARAAAKSPDSIAVSNTVLRFYRALATADSTDALALLAPDVLILEGGEIQDYDQYRASHLAADIAYSAAVPSTRVMKRITVIGDAAWVTSQAITQGTYRNRAINSEGAELMVLSRVGRKWRIRAIHWSSRTRR